MELKLSLSSGPVTRIQSDLLIALVGREHGLFDPSALAPLLAPVRVGYESGKLKGEQLVALPASFKTRSLLVYNLDAAERQEFGEKVAIALPAVCASACAKGFNRAVVLFGLGTKWTDRAVSGALLGSYSFTKYKAKKDKRKLDLSFHVEAGDRKAVSKTLEEHAGVARCANEARALVNEPANVATISEVVRMAKTVARETGLSCRVLDERALKKSNFNGLLTVGRSGSEPPRMVILQYRPAKKTDKHLCLVGKGIIFDSGGICLKPASDMWTMKADMAGAAAALFALKAIVARKPSFAVSAVLCLAENLPGSRATRPGDIFRAANGKSVHVENTDAEGRLVLSDGLVMAGKLKSTHVADLATLTGACIVALGDKIAGVMGNNPEFSAKLQKAADLSGEPLWPFPLPDYYRELIDHPCADLNNMGLPMNGSAIMGGLFLKEFAPEGAAWAHLDIAGPAFFKKKWKYYAEGATGFGVRLLAELAKIL